jgi:hypothetical protein
MWGMKKKEKITIFLDFGAKVDITSKTYSSSKSKFNYLITFLLHDPVRSCMNSPKDSLSAWLSPGTSFQPGYRLGSLKLLLPGSVSNFFREDRDIL